MEELEETDNNLINRNSRSSLYKSESGFQLDKQSLDETKNQKPKNCDDKIESHVKPSVK